MNYDIIIQRLMGGNPYISEDEYKEMNLLADTIISNGTINQYYYSVLYKLLKICNIIYNNAPNQMSPLSDDKYDRLMVMCRRQGVEYPIGSPPVQFQDINPDFERVDIPEANKKKEVMVLLDTKMPYYQDLTRNQLPIKENYIIEDLSKDPQDFRKKRVKTTENNLCGTLDKCKYVYDHDAKACGVYLDPTVSIFQRDFLVKHIQMGLVDPNNITLIASLKYDGISVECTIENGQVISAFTRGDTNNDEAVDLTPVFKGLTFPRCKYMNRCNVKFEIIMTDRAMEYVNEHYDKTHYVNPRNAVIGLMGGLDARLFRDIVTPVPLESDIFFNIQYSNSRRIVEIEFLNSHFSKVVDLRSVVIHGTLDEVLYKVKMYSQSADKLRGYMGFWFDGIVVEYADDRIRNILGKTKSVPNYSIAIKFPPLTAQSTFTHYTYSVGQTGIITPKAHFLPVTFMGQTHDKASVHSFRKVKEFGLRAGDKVNLTFANDVMVYLTPAPLEEQPKDNPNPVEEFPSTCPSCGHQVMISESGDTAYCININCPERVIGRMAGFLSRINATGFDKAAIRALQVHNLRELLNVSREHAEAALGEKQGSKFKDMLIDIMNQEYPDYRLMHAIGFTGCGPEYWKKALRHFHMERLLTSSDNELRAMEGINGIGNKFVTTIISERPFLLDDIKVVLEKFKIIQTPLNYRSLGKIAFSGVRDKNLVDLFNKCGYEADDNSNVSKDTVILVVPMMGYTSGNVSKAFHWQNKRLTQHNATKADFYIGRTITGYNDQDLVDGVRVYPKIMTIDEAYKYINYLSNK